MADGNVYEGDFRNDVFHGKGAIVFRPMRKGDKGIRFEGQFEHGMQALQGKLIYPNGDIYEGPVEEYRRTGRGVLAQ